MNVEEKKEARKRNSRKYYLKSGDFIRKNAREYAREHSADQLKWKHANPTKNAKYSRKWRETNPTTVWFKKYKATLKCNRCPESRPIGLDFDHLNMDDAEKMAVSTLVRGGYTKERVIAEIEKCEVLCAICHRQEHEDQRNRAA